MKQGRRMRSLAAVGMALVLLAACKKDDEETEETDTAEESAEEPKEEPSAEPEESASAEEETPPPPVTTTTTPKPKVVGACTAQGQCSGGFCCSDGSKTFCSEPRKPCGTGRVVCSRDGQCGKKACLPEPALPGVKTCQTKSATPTAPKPAPPAPKPTSGVTPFGKPGLQVAPKPVK